MDHPSNKGKTYTSEQDRKDRKALGLDVNYDHAPFFTKYGALETIPKEAWDALDKRQRINLGLDK